MPVDMESSGVAQKAGRILIVDDEAIIRGMLEIELSERYEVYAAESGPKALELLKSQPVDLVISDINMPGMKGFELLAEVQRRYPSVKTALITAYNTDDYIRMAKEHGIANIIPKSTPFNFDELETLVHGLVSEQIFGLSRHLKPDHTIVAQYIVRGSDDIASTEEDIMRHVATFYPAEPFVQILLEELITNAVYHAPVDGNGRRKYEKHSVVRLETSEAVAVTLGRDNEKFGVSVLDRSGRLSKAQVLYHIDRHVSAEGILDESGRGLHMSRLYADRLIVNIKRGVATEVLFLIYTEKKYIGFTPLYIYEV